MWSIWHNISRPSLAAALVFIVSLGSVLFSSIALNVSTSVIYTLTINVTLNIVILVFILFSKHAHKKFTKLEIYSVAIVFLSLLMWYLSDNAWFGLILPTAVDTLGMILVIRKLSRDPGSEDVVTWGFAGAAYVFTFLGLSDYQLKDLLFTILNIIFCSWIAIKSYRCIR